MGTFHFDQQLNLSFEAVQKITAWLNQRDTVEWAIDVQNKPECHYLGDIQVKAVGDNPEFIEVKVETRTSQQTPNLAIERFSDTARQTNGGAWSTRAKFYSHIYADGLLVMMRREPLLSWLIQEYETFRQFQANNGGYVTTGILVPREDAQKSLRTNYKQYWIDKE